MERTPRRPKEVAKRLPSQTEGKHWTVRVVSRVRDAGVECWGWCDYGKREILISKSAERKGVDRDTLIHELTHRAFPWMTEDAVELFATDLDEALDVMGM